MSKKFFIVTPRNKADKNAAKMLEDLANRPSFVKAVMDEVNKRLQENMEEIIFGRKP